MRSVAIDEAAASGVSREHARPAPAPRGPARVLAGGAGGVHRRYTSHTHGIRFYNRGIARPVTATSG